MTDKQEDQPGSFESSEVDSYQIDESDVAEIEEADPSPESVTYSGTDFDVEGLVRRFLREDIVIPSFGANDPTLEVAGFQRGFVWRRSQMDRFIESLLLGYPIPGIFLVQQSDKRYLVLDGQQRIKTLGAFYEGIHQAREFALHDVADQFKGLTYKTLPIEYRRLLDNTFIQATIVKSDGSPDSLDAVYQVFERLNSGGTQLTSHEIRVALYAGPFIEYLTELNLVESWRHIYGKPSPRIRDQEVILRFVALYVSADSFRRPLKKFLNDFVGRNRSLESLDTEKIRSRFVEAATLIANGPGAGALRYLGNQVNAALTEAILVGLAHRIDTGDDADPSKVGERISTLLDDMDFVDAISRATSNEEKVAYRLAKATEAFSTI